MKPKGSISLGSKVLFFLSVIVVCIAIYSFYSLGNQLADERHQLGANHTQLVEACNRLQILRVEDNVSHYADYKVYQVVYQESRVAEHMRHLSPQQQHEEVRFLTPLLSAIEHKTWVPRTNCAQAVALKGSRYRPPDPIPFVKELPPTSALTLSTKDFQ